MSYSYATSAAIINRAGLNINATAASSSAIMQNFSDDAEGFIMGQTDFDWVTNLSKVAATLVPTVADAITNTAAIYLVQYDMGAIGNSEAANRINILHDRANRAIKQLKEDHVKTTLGVT